MSVTPDPTTNIILSKVDLNSTRRFEKYKQRRSSKSPFQNEELKLADDALYGTQSYVDITIPKPVSIYHSNDMQMLQISGRHTRQISSNAQEQQ